MTQGGSVSGTDSRSQMYSGCVKNLRNTINQEKIIMRWANSIIKGIPFSAGKSRYSFLLCPQNGARPERVILYGDAAGSIIREGETVFVTGRKDKDGIIIGELIYEPNFDKHIQTERVFSGTSMRIAAVLVFAAVVYMIALFTRLAVSGISFGLSNPGSLLRVVVLLVPAALCLKSRSRSIRKIGWILIGLGISVMYPPIIVVVILFYVLKWMLR